MFFAGLFSFQSCTRIAMSFVRVIPFLLVLILISGMNAKKLKKEVNNSLLLRYLKIDLKKRNLWAFRSSTASQGALFSYNFAKEWALEWRVIDTKKKSSSNPFLEIRNIVLVWSERFFNCSSQTKSCELGLRRLPATRIRRLAAQFQVTSSQVKFIVHCLDFFTKEKGNMEVWGEKKKKTSGTRVSFDIQSAFPNTCVKKVLNKDSNVNEPINTVICYYRRNHEMHVVGYNINYTPCFWY